MSASDDVTPLVRAHADRRDALAKVIEPVLPEAKDRHRVASRIASEVLASTVFEQIVAERAHP